MLRSHGNGRTTDRTKRQSMYISSSSFDPDSFSDDNTGRGHVFDNENNIQIKVDSFEEDTTIKKKQNKTRPNRIKRSTIVLDDKMVKEYNLAIKSMNDSNSNNNSDLLDAETVRSPSDISIFSSNSSNSTISSVRDLIYQELDSILDEKNNKASGWPSLHTKQNRKHHIMKDNIPNTNNNSNTKAFFIITDDISVGGQWQPINEGHYDMLFNDNSNDNNDKNDNYNSLIRTELDFF